MVDVDENARSEGSDICHLLCKQPYLGLSEDHSSGIDLAIAGTSSPSHSEAVLFRFLVTVSLRSGSTLPLGTSRRY